MTNLKKRPLVIKLVYGDDIRRWRYNTQEDVPQYQEMVSFIPSAFDVKKFRLKYVDDEQDRLTIATQQDLQDAIDCATDEERKSLKIYVTKNEPEAPKPKPKAKAKSFKPKKCKPMNGACICGDALVLTPAQFLYNGRGVFCDSCDLECSRQSHVYHCNHYSRKHLNGYDLCVNCYKTAQDVPFVYPMLVNDNISPMEQARIDAIHRLERQNFPQKLAKLTKRMSEAAAALRSETSLSSNSCNEWQDPTEDLQLQRAIEKSKKEQELKQVEPVVEVQEVDMELDEDEEDELKEQIVEPKEEPKEQEVEPKEKVELGDESKEEEQARLDAIDRLASIYLGGNNQLLMKSLQKAKNAQKQSLLQNVMEARSQEAEADVELVEAELAVVEKAEKKEKFKYQQELDLLAMMGYHDFDQLKVLLVKYQGDVSQLFQEL